MKKWQNVLNVSLLIGIIFFAYNLYFANYAKEVNQEEYELKSKAIALILKEIADNNYYRGLSNHFKDQFYVHKNILHEDSFFAQINAKTTSIQGDYLVNRKERVAIHSSLTDEKEHLQYLQNLNNWLDTSADWRRYLTQEYRYFYLENYKAEHKLCYNIMAEMMHLYTDFKVTNNEVDMNLKLYLNTLGQAVNAHNGSQLIEFDNSGTLKLPLEKKGDQIFRLSPNELKNSDRIGGYIFEIKVDVK